jgi:transposase
VKMVIETSRPVAIVAKELGINESTLGNWVNLYRREHAGEEPPPTLTERAWLRELERENRELKMENGGVRAGAAPDENPDSLLQGLRPPHCPLISGVMTLGVRFLADGNRMAAG